MKLNLKKKKSKISKVKTENNNATNKTKNTKVISKESFKDGLMEVNVQEEKYDKLFEQKLASQYQEFRNIKDHKLQSIKFIRIIIILAVIMVVALLLMSYR